MTDCPRVVTFEEMDAWLEALPAWESLMESTGKAQGGSIAGSGGVQGSSYRSTSLVEREALLLAEISVRVQLIRRAIEQLHQSLQDLVQTRYLARTPTRGNSVHRTCQLLGISRAEYFEMRERALLPILVRLYFEHVDPGHPFSYCEYR